MAPSTSTPIEMAMPASDITLTETPARWSGMNDSSTETGIVTMGTMAEGKCHRKNRMTSETMTICSTSSCVSVWMARVMRSDRS